jgi:hypothetical protein
MYRIDFSSVAKAEADAAFLSFSQFTTADRAQTWYQGLIRAIVSLQEMPRRCPIACENIFLVRKSDNCSMGAGNRLIAFCLPFLMTSRFRR